VPFIATIHDDHTALRHVHGFFMVEGRLNREEFKKIKGLWKIASAEARQQRRRLDGMRSSLGYKKLLPLIEKYKRKHQQGSNCLVCQEDLVCFYILFATLGCHRC
jgi:hypothetical protein